MTRINIIKPEVLTNRHLIAEYKEITQVIYPMVCSTNKYPTCNIHLPSEYGLSGGHMKFFYNKGLYLEKRYETLFEELSKRNFNLDPVKYNNHRVRFRKEFPAEWYNDWKPNPKDIVIILQRIKERIFEKPHLYPDKDRFLLSEYYNTGLVATK